MNANSVTGRGEVAVLAGEARQSWRILRPRDPRPPPPNGRPSSPSRRRRPCARAAAGSRTGRCARRAQWGELPLWGATRGGRRPRSGRCGRLRAHDPQGVIAALEKAMQTRPPKPTATPFSLAVDAEGGASASGSTPLPARGGGAARPRDRARAHPRDVDRDRVDQGHGDELDVVLKTPLERADLLRLQARLSTRGALDAAGARLRPRAPAARRGRRPRRVEGPRRRGRALRRRARGEDALRARRRDAARRPARGEPRPRRPPTSSSSSSRATPTRRLDERSIAVGRDGAQPRGRPRGRRARGRSAAKARVARFAAERAGGATRSSSTASPRRRPRRRPRARRPGRSPSPRPTTPRRASSRRRSRSRGRSAASPTRCRPSPPRPTYGADPPPDNQVARVTADFGKLVDPMLDPPLEGGARGLDPRRRPRGPTREIERGVGARAEQDVTRRSAGEVISWSPASRKRTIPSAPKTTSAAQAATTGLRLPRAPRSDATAPATK